MRRLLDHPLILSVISLVVLWLFAHGAALLGKKLHPLDEQERGDLNVVVAATLTLLGLIIGFSFSMAIGRYDQRKNYEAEEANAIGTEYSRAELLPDAEAARVRGLLRSYVDQRVLFYMTRDETHLRQINNDTVQLQARLWSTVRTAAAASPTAPAALAVAGMNDVLNSQAYTQAAWWNRIPTAAWALMAILAVCCNLLIGYTSHRTGNFSFLVLPLALSISFLLIADLDSPHGGVIYVEPHNLESLSQSLNAR